MKNSAALERVLKLKDPVTQKSLLNGLYLSNNQIIKLGRTLKLLEANGGASGICFMVGEDIIAGKPTRTVELIPFKDVDNEKEFYKRGEITGYIHVNVGKEKPSSPKNFVIDSDKNHFTNSAAQPKLDAPVVVNFVEGDRNNPQRTPPPFSI